MRRAGAQSVKQIFILWSFSFFNDTATTEIYTLSLHDALPICTIYLTIRPDLRDWSDWTKRDTWGEPVAKFVRKAGLFQSADGGMTGGMTNTAQLVSSHTFAIFGKSFNFADLIPHGMTCFETGVGDENGEAEAGTCTAIGGTP